VCCSHHSPPQCVGVAAELGDAVAVHGVLLRQVHEVGGEDQAQEADVQGGDELLEVTGERVSVDHLHSQRLVS